jgi:hypothetical protein
MALATPSASAVTVFSSTFVSSEGFTEGSPATNFTPGLHTMISQDPVTTTDVAGAGTLSHASGATGGSFSRAVLGNNTTDAFDETLILGMPAGSTISFAAIGVTIVAVNNPAANNNVFVFGLANYDELNAAGSSSNSGAGARVYVDANGNVNAATSTEFNPAAGSHVDTTINLGETFNLEVILTANGDGTFDVTQFYNGVLRFTDLSVAPDFSKSGTEAAGILQAQGGNGAGPASTTVDAITISYNVIPEPDSLLLVVMGAFGLLWGRRKRS